MISFSKNIFLLVNCVFICLLSSCRQNEPEPFTYIPETIPPDVETSDATVFRWAEPSVFRITEPVVQTEVSNTEFKELYSAGKKGASEDRCIKRTYVEEGETLLGGYYRINENGDPVKLCTKSECRENQELPCEHLYTNSRDYIWYEDCLYIAADTFSYLDSSYTASRFIILKWENGSDTFEKFFETELVIRGLQITNGILYVETHTNTTEDPFGFYAINLEEKVYTYIPTPDFTYIFGDSHILYIGNSGVSITDSVLNPRELCCNFTISGYLEGHYYWYLNPDEHTVYCVNLLNPGEAFPVKRGVDDFVVCDGNLYYIPYTGEEPGVLFYYRKVKSDAGKKTLLEPLYPHLGYAGRAVYSAVLNTNGTLQTEKRIFTPQQGEWFSSMGDMYGNESPGRHLILRTILPGDEQYIKYYINEYCIYNGIPKLISRYAQPAEED